MHLPLEPVNIIIILMVALSVTAARMRPITASSHRVSGENSPIQACCLGGVVGGGDRGVVGGPGGGQAGVGWGGEGRRAVTRGGGRYHRDA